MKSTGSIRKVALDFVKSAADELFAGNFVGNFEQTLTHTTCFLFASFSLQLTIKEKEEKTINVDHVGGQNMQCLGMKKGMFLKNGLFFSLLEVLSHYVLPYMALLSGLKYLFSVF